MSDIRITPRSSIMSFTSSLNYVETLKQDDSGSLNLYGSGSLGRTEIFSIDGNNGRLFTVSDDLSDSLFSVNTIAGLPVIEAFANNTVVMGQYGTNALVVSGSNVGIGTVSPTNKLTILGADDTIPALGSSGGKFGIFNGVSGTPTYGLLQGVLGTGNSYLQVQRIDGTATAYNLLLQPNGGNIVIGGTSSLTSDVFQVNGSGYFNSNVNVGGGLTINGSLNSGASNFAGYRQGGDNIILKGNSTGVSGIFFQSEKDGTNINHPSDYGYIQFHSYGIDGTTGESNKLVIGVANDADDMVILQSPNINGVKISYLNSASGTGGTEYTVWHAGNHGTGSGLDADLLDGQDSSYFFNSSAETQFKFGGNLILVGGFIDADSFIKDGGTSTQILIADGSVIEKSDFYQVNKGGVSTQDSLVANGNQTLSIASTSTNFDGDLSNITFEGTFANFNGSSNSNKSLGFTLAVPTSINQGIYYKTWYSASTPWRRLWDTSNFSQSNINNWNTAHGWGDHASAGYALASGTNATDNWSNTSSGLSLNPSVAGKTLNASGQTVNLRDATYGQISGVVQDSTNGPITNEWSNRLKTLHNNSAGYFTELAQSFTGTEGVWHRRNSAGTISSWKRLYDDSIWSVASLSYSGSTLTLTINGISKTTTISAGSTYTAGTNISISSNQISVVDSPTFAESVTASAFYESSLRELKENIQHFEKSGLELVNSLEIVTFDKKDGSAKDKIGIIADDSPEEFLSENKDAVDLYKTVFIQAKAIQELNAKNLDLENTVNCLEDQIQNLRELITLKLTK